MLRTASRAALLGLLTAVPASALAEDLTFVYTASWEREWSQAIPTGERQEQFPGSGIWFVFIGDTYQGPLGSVSVPQFDPNLGTLNLVTQELEAEANIVSLCFLSNRPEWVLLHQFRALS